MKAVINRGNNRANDSVPNNNLINEQGGPKSADSSLMDCYVRNLRRLTSMISDGDYVREIYKDMKDKTIPISVGAKLLANRVINIVFLNKETYFIARIEPYYIILAEAMESHFANVISNGNFDENALKGIDRIIDEIMVFCGIDYSILAEFKEKFHDLF